eukprot:1184704-Prorocentrum_minimum.AAC.8
MRIPRGSSEQRAVRLLRRPAQHAQAGSGGDGGGGGLVLGPHQDGARLPGVQERLPPLRPDEREAALRLLPPPQAAPPAPQAELYAPPRIKQSRSQQLRTLDKSLSERHSLSTLLYLGNLQSNFTRAGSLSRNRNSVSLKLHGPLASNFPHLPLPKWPHRRL